MKGYKMFQYGDYVTLNARNEKGKASTHIVIEKLTKVG